jgi:hypothetical protein
MMFARCRKTEGKQQTRILVFKEGGRSHDVGPSEGLKGWDAGSLMLEGGIYRDAIYVADGHRAAPDIVTGGGVYIQGRARPTHPNA